MRLLTAKTLLTLWLTTVNHAAAKDPIACNVSAGCEASDQFCGDGFCWECWLSIGSTPSPFFCSGNSTEDCIDTCYSDFACSEESPCSDGQWCGFQLGSRGICTDCSEVDNFPGLCNVMPFAAGQDACKSTCFPGCSSNADCQDGIFCTFENPNDGSGYCTNCTAVTSGGPKDCLNTTVVFNWTENGQESCLSRCFDACADSGTCANQTGFCHKIEGADSKPGYCESCQEYDPFYCYLFDYGEDNGRECASNCFGECTPTEGCTEDSFCALGPSEVDFGDYCMNCSWVANDVQRCFQRNTTDEGKELCAVTCFGACDKETPCDEGSFCTFQNGGDGYCTPCNFLDPIRCTDLGPEGQESCVISCFDVCSESLNKTCPVWDDYNLLFCDYQLNATAGACASCPYLYSDGTTDTTCDVWNQFDNLTSLTESGKESCSATCFRPCQQSSVKADCGPEHDCDQGFCRPYRPDTDDGTTITSATAKHLAAAGWGTAVGFLVPLFSVVA